MDIFDICLYNPYSPSLSSVWLASVGSIVVISLVGLLAVAALPLLRGKHRKAALQVGEMMVGGDDGDHGGGCGGDPDDRGVGDHGAMMMMVVTDDGNPGGLMMLMLMMTTIITL